MSTIAYQGPLSLLTPAAAGLRDLSGNLAGGGYLSWVETSGTPGAVGLYRDPTMSQVLPAEIHLDSRGSVLAWGRGYYNFILKDRFGNTVLGFDCQLGEEEVIP